MTFKQNYPPVQFCKGKQMEAPLRTAANSVTLKGSWSNWEALWSPEAMNVAWLWEGWLQLWSRWESLCRSSTPVSLKDHFKQICMIFTSVKAEVLVCNP